MYLKRKIDTFLADWKKDPAQMPLIVRGARQVGKTEAIRNFAKANYKNVIEINFVEEPQYKGIIEEGFKTESIIKLISRLNPSHRFIPGETLIFFDEIQEFPEIATSLKFFQINGCYDVICSGSLLGIQQKRIESNSVGYKTDYTMRSFDFEEFLWAIGYPEDIADDMLSHMTDNKPFTQAELTKYFSLFMDYILLGGMPAVLRAYVTTQTFERTIQIQKQLLLDYQEDIQKYAEGLDKAKILAVFNHIAPQLAKENKKFQFSKIAKGARSREYFGCVQWLLDAGVISSCYCLNFPELPLKGNYNESKYKLYIADTGLLLALFGFSTKKALLNGTLKGFAKGGIYENFVAETLTKNGYSLHYYKPNDSSELEFIIEKDGEVIPIEVKAGNSPTKSLDSFVEEFEPTVAFKLIGGNVGRNNKKLTIPHFLAMYI